MKTAVVSGAGTGIGAEVSKLLIDRGYRVIGLGRTAANLEQTARSCSTPENFIAFSLDVRDRRALHRVFGEVDFVDALVANSGICKRTEIDAADADDVFDDVMQTNVQGVWNLFRTVTPKLAKGASAVVVSSGLGKLARPGYSAYAASKHAVLGMMRCLALELAPRDIRVNAVCPGWVDTGMARADLDYSAAQNGTTQEQEYAAATASIPMGRFVQPQEVAQLIGWLLSDEASAITAQSYNISCGEFYV